MVVGHNDIPALVPARLQDGFILSGWRTVNRCLLPDSRRVRTAPGKSYRLQEQLGSKQRLYEVDEVVMQGSC